MRLLLDAHVARAVARQLQRDGLDVVSIADWRDGDYRGAPDDQLLVAAASEQRVLVSYDCQTIPPLLKEWAETGLHHGGVVLVDEQTIRPSDIGGLTRALRALLAERRDEDWRDRVRFVFLRAP